MKPADSEARKFFGCPVNAKHHEHLKVCVEAGTSLHYGCEVLAEQITRRDAELRAVIAEMDAALLRAKDAVNAGDMVAVDEAIGEAWVAQNALPGEVKP